jgi:hypothetical protein
MNGKASLAIPMTFENTKFSSVAEKIKNLVTVEKKRWLHMSWHEVIWRKESSRTLSHSRKVKWFG